VMKPAPPYGTKVQLPELQTQLIFEYRCCKRHAAGGSPLGWRDPADDQFGEPRISLRENEWTCLEQADRAFAIRHADRLLEFDMEHPRHQT
jgi:hypothetical protein